jgi:hypothetical protein
MACAGSYNEQALIASLSILEIPPRHHPYPDPWIAVSTAFSQPPASLKIKLTNVSKRAICIESDNFDAPLNPVDLFGPDGKRIDQDSFGYGFREDFHGVGYRYPIYFILPGATLTVDEDLRAFATGPGYQGDFAFKPGRYKFEVDVGWSFCRDIVDLENAPPSAGNVRGSVLIVSGHFDALPPRR